MRVDIRDAGKKKYSRTPPDPSASPMPGGPNLRGRKDDQPEVRLSKTISWLLRHGAQGQGLAMRPDGYVRVKDLVSSFSVSSPSSLISSLLARWTIECS
jgi:hypothetical protein